MKYCQVGRRRLAAARVPRARRSIIATQQPDDSGTRAPSLLEQDDLATLRDALDRSNREVENLFTLSLDLICIAGLDGHFKRVNPALERALGYSSDELIARSLLDFVHPDDLSRTLRELEGLATGASTTGFINRFQTRSGSFVWLAWNAAPSPEDGSIYGVARDITADRAREQDLRDREAYLRGVFEAVIDGLITIDSRGIVASYNDGAERLFGWTAAEVVGRNVNMLMPEPYRSGHDRYVQAFLETREPKVIGRSREVTGLRRNGTVFPMSLSVTEVRGSAATMFVGLVRDLTEQRKTEAATHAMLARDAFQQGRIDVASGILHDLGNALTGIGSRAVEVEAIVGRSNEHAVLAERTAEFLRGNQEALQTGLGVAKGQALVSLVESLASEMALTRAQALQGLAKMVSFLSHAQELLTTHRSYSGAGSGPVKERAPVGKFLDDIVMLTADSVIKRGGTIAIRSEDRLPMLYVERSKLLQVMINLVKNAVEACDSPSWQRPPTIQISARHDGSGLAIEVTDDGPGFTDALAEQVFEPGFSTKGRGSGVGLGASRRIVEAMGGRLELSSPGPGQGATARLHFSQGVFAE